MYRIKHAHSYDFLRFYGYIFSCRGGGYKANFPRSVIFRIFQHCQNTRKLLNCSAAVTPVKYECDSKNLTGTFARSKILLVEKLTNGALVTPTLGRRVFLKTDSRALTS